jgi:hypothetical protein
MMPLAWAQRPAALVRDCVVAPDVFHSLVDRLGVCVVPSQHALGAEARQRHRHRSLVGLLSHLDCTHAETIAAFVAVERLVLQALVVVPTWISMAIPPCRSQP